MDIRDRLSRGTQSSAWQLQAAEVVCPALSQVHALLSPATCLLFLHTHGHPIVPRVWANVLSPNSKCLGVSVLGLHNKGPQTEGLNNRNVFPTVLRLEVRDQGASTARFWCDPLPGLKGGPFSLCPHTAFLGSSMQSKLSLFLFLQSHPAHQIMAPPL